MVGAPTVASEPSTEPTRRQLSARQAETVRRLTVAAADELREVPYEKLTIRNVARRAGVAPATAYTYFASREHLVTEVFWRLLEALPPTEGAKDAPAAERVADAMADVSMLVADEPELAAACTAAMLATDPEVNLLRDRIGAAMRERLRGALGEISDPVVLRTLELSLSPEVRSQDTVRVVAKPLTAYLQWELHALRMRERCGAGLEAKATGNEY
jgi:AcrR family transcriptional regulator